MLTFLILYYSQHWKELISLSYALKGIYPSSSFKILLDSWWGKARRMEVSRKMVPRWLLPSLALRSLNLHAWLEVSFTINPSRLFSPLLLLFDIGSYGAGNYGMCGRWVYAHSPQSMCIILMTILYVRIYLLELLVPALCTCGPMLASLWWVVNRLLTYLPLYRERILREQARSGR
jgi:hypothetical protein